MIDVYIYIWLHMYTIHKSVYAYSIFRITLLSRHIISLKLRTIAPNTPGDNKLGKGNHFHTMWVKQKLSRQGTQNNVGGGRRMYDIIWQCWGWWWWWWWRWWWWWWWWWWWCCGRWCCGRWCWGWRGAGGWCGEWWCWGGWGWGWWCWGGWG